MKTKVCLLIAAAALLLSAVWFGKPEHSAETLGRHAKRPVFVVDPGHGGEDGGAVSLDGLRESEVNLAISLRIDSLLGLFGYPAVLTRDSEALTYPPEATTVRRRKQADLERRVSLIIAASDAILLSIHQNKYPTAGPRGAQVFYRDDPQSALFASIAHKALAIGAGDTVRDPAIIPDSIYLMRKVRCPAILVECGFLSNTEELQLLRSEAYQTRLALCLAYACAEYAEEWEREYGQGG